MSTVRLIPSSSSLSRRILFIICLIISIISISYFIISIPKLSSSTHSFVSSLKSLSIGIDSTQCHLSQVESDGWFCEFDSDWKRRKQLHHIQDKRNRISDARHMFFQNNWEPTIQCEFEQRIGGIGDGGKWICDVERFKQMNNTDLLIYSFGSRGEFSFEQAIKEQLSTAEIHTFDLKLYKCPNNTCIFHQMRLGNGKDNTSKSLKMIMNELGHQNRQIHILKVDIEGSEFDLFEELFDLSLKNKTNIPYIRQILFEIHIGSDPTNALCQRTHKLFELFRSNYYAIYHKEVNLYDPHNVFEYGLLRLNAAFFNPLRPDVAIWQHFVNITL